MSEIIEMRKNYAVWEVGGNEYKLKLGAAATTDLEKKIGKNLLAVLQSEDELTLSNMLLITHAAMKKYTAGIRMEDVYDIYDKYVDNGGSITDFLRDVFMEIYRVSGFFTNQKKDKPKAPEVMPEESPEEEQP